MLDLLLGALCAGVWVIRSLELGPLEGLTACIYGGLGIGWLSCYR